MTFEEEERHFLSGARASSLKVTYSVRSVSFQNTVTDRRHRMDHIYLISNTFDKALLVVGKTANRGFVEVGVSQYPNTAPALEDVSTLIASYVKEGWLLDTNAKPDAKAVEFDFKNKIKAADSPKALLSAVGLHIFPRIGSNNLRLLDQNFDWASMGLKERADAGNTAIRNKDKVWQPKFSQPMTPITAEERLAMAEEQRMERIRKLYETNPEVGSW